MSKQEGTLPGVVVVVGLAVELDVVELGVVDVEGWEVVELELVEVDVLEQTMSPWWRHARTSLRRHFPGRDVAVHAASMSSQASLHCFRPARRAAAVVPPP